MVEENFDDVDLMPRSIFDVFLYIYAFISIWTILVACPEAVKLSFYFIWAILFIYGLIFGKLRWAILQAIALPVILGFIFIVSYGIPSVIVWFCKSFPELVPVIIRIGLIVLAIIIGIVLLVFCCTESQDREEPSKSSKYYVLSPEEEEYRSPSFSMTSVFGGRFG